MWISVILPTFNSGKFIKDTVHSVLNQSHNDLELIVVDDCSTDNTCEIVSLIQKKDSRLKLFRLEKNSGGPARPRNFGIQASKFEWISFIDSDDLWHKDKLSHQVEVLRHNPNLRFVSTEIVNFRGDFKNRWPGTFNNDRHLRFRDVIFKVRTATSTVLLERSLFDIQYFNESPSYKAREDMDIWLKFHENIDYSYKIGRKLVAYRLTSDQISGDKKRMFLRHMYVLKNYRLENGRKLGFLSLFFTITHFTIAFIDRSLGRSV